MKRLFIPFSTAATLLVASTLVFGQDQPQSGGGWPRVAASPNPYQTANGQQSAGPQQSADAQRTPDFQQNADAEQADAQQNQSAQQNQNDDREPPPPPDNNNQPYPNRPSYNQPAPPRNQQAPPSQLTIARGTYITVRVNQSLSSDKNQQGDAFAATLAQPVVVNGFVVAEPGQTLGGQVVESTKAGRVEGVARLGIRLTDLTLVDGQQVPIQSQLIARKADTSLGRDAGAIVGTTALGAAIGGAADWGRGAAIGAGAGLVASTIGVLVTRGHSSVIYPEQLLTFRIEAPVLVSTASAPQAFQYVQQDQYGDNPYYRQAPETRSLYASAPPPSPYYYGNPYPYYYGYPSFYYGYGYPGYNWGPSVGLYFGRGYGYGYRGGYSRGGNHRGGRR